MWRHALAHGGVRRALCTKLSAPTGIFVDAENLSGFLRNGGARQIISWAVELGNPIVRKAYGNWNTMQGLERGLVENGFQLIHTPYPVAGKSAADIAMVVDVMGVLYTQKELQTFVLATGDSDFSHLFCHLRQTGRTVVGVGPDSPLSRIVKNSCDRYILIPSTRAQHHMAVAGDWDAGRELVRRALDSLPLGEERVQIGRLKDQMLRLDSSFNLQLYPECSTFGRFVASAHLADVMPPIIRDQLGNMYLDLASATRVALSATQDNVKRDPGEVFFGPVKWDEAQEPVKWDEARELVQRALDSLDLGVERVQISALKDHMLRLDSSFDQRRFGCRSWREFLNSDALVGLIPEIFEDARGNHYFNGSSTDGPKSLRVLPFNGSSTDVPRSLRLLAFNFFWGMRLFKRLPSEAVKEVEPSVHPLSHWQIDSDVGQQLLDADNEAFFEVVDAVLYFSAQFHGVPFTIALERNRHHLQSARAQHLDWISLARSQWELVNEDLRDPSLAPAAEAAKQAAVKAFEHDYTLVLEKHGMPALQAVLRQLIAGGETSVASKSKWISRIGTAFTQARQSVALTDVESEGGKEGEGGAEGKASGAAYAFIADASQALLSPEALRSLSRSELQKTAKSFGQKANGKSEEIIAALSALRTNAATEPCLPQQPSP